MRDLGGGQRVLGLLIAACLAGGLALLVGCVTLHDCRTGVDGVAYVRCDFCTGVDS